MKSYHRLIIITNYIMPYIHEADISKSLQFQTCFYVFIASVFKKRLFYDESFETKSNDVLIRNGQSK